MTYALLPVHHANVRYRASIEALALAELQVLMRGQARDCVWMQAGMMRLLRFDAPAGQDTHSLIGESSCCQALFEWVDGLLRPLDVQSRAVVGDDISGVLKYKGKTNEDFCALLLNLAVHSGAYAGQYGVPLEVLDPMCGKGTVLFEALKKGYVPYGVEIDAKDVTELNQFFRKYLEFHRFKHKVERTSMTADGKAAGTKHEYRFAQDSKGLKEAPHLLTVTSGDARHLIQFYRGKRFHAIACDLPYGVQHAGMAQGKPLPPEALLQRMLPVWKQALLPGACVAVSFNAQTLPLDRAREVMAQAGLAVLAGGAYDGFSHWVEQAVTRDVAVGKWEKPL